MVWGYLRISTDAQEVKSQKLGIEEWLADHALVCHKWVADEDVSGNVPLNQRKLGYLLNHSKRGDIIVASELSRVARSLPQLLAFYEKCLAKGLEFHTVKDRYSLDDSIQAKILIAVAGLASELELDLLHRRTREGIERVRREDKRIGALKVSRQ